MNVRSCLPKPSILLAALVVACGGAPAPVEQRFEATLRVVSDDAEPLGDAKFTLGKQALGTTSNAGTLTVRLRGSEGQALKLSLVCPDGYAEPPTLPLLRLTRTRRVGEQASQPLSFETVCTRQTRSVALVVRAMNGNALPVLVNGMQQTSTDSDGNAHLLLKVDRSQQSVNVKLDTTTRPDLKPASPERTFELRGRDAVLLFEPSITAAPARRAVQRTAAPAAPRHVPYRID